MPSFRPDGSELKYCSTALHRDRTMLPVALPSLFDEARRMHGARQLVAQVPAIVPLGCFVDGLFYSSPPEADRALRALAEAERYEQVSANVFKFKGNYRCDHVPQCDQQSSAAQAAFAPSMGRNRHGALLGAAPGI